ncbi:hypothetical protein [Undibacterium crateris]|uniref:hypothetical protein n=1 Tax=Undibacterium crateris TaxID=2528175 RepID=UPI00192ED7C3|nr:hypothetical protein [Undibacterium crateris]
MSTPRTKSTLAGKLGKFVQEYGRKAQKGLDPNDRNYDRKIEEKMKRLPPDQLSELLTGEDALIEPITQIELEALLQKEIERCSPNQQQFFETHRVPLYLVPIHRFRTVEQVFVLAEIKEDVLYYEDVEEGFEIAHLGPDGAIPEQGCNQYELKHVLTQLGL